MVLIQSSLSSIPVSGFFRSGTLILMTLAWAGLPFRITNCPATITSAAATNRTASPFQNGGRGGSAINGDRGKPHMACAKRSWTGVPSGTVIVCGVEADLADSIFGWLGACDWAATFRASRETSKTRLMLLIIESPNQW